MNASPRAQTYNKRHKQQINGPASSSPESDGVQKANNDEFRYLDLSFDDLKSIDGGNNGEEADGEGEEDEKEKEDGESDEEDGDSDEEDGKGEEEEEEEEDGEEDEGIYKGPHKRKRQVTKRRRTTKLSRGK